MICCEGCAKEKRVYNKWKEGFFVILECNVCKKKNQECRWFSEGR